MVIKLPKINKDIALYIVFKVFNNTASLNSLVFILLVFGAYL